MRDPLLPATRFLLQPASMPRGAQVATAAMALAVALANRLAQLPLGPWLTWGTPVISLTFLINEITHQLYGPSVARRVVTRGFWVALAISLIIAPPRIALASASAYLTSQLLDIAIFRRLRHAPKRFWWVAPAGASTAASLLDTAIFFIIAFLGTPLSWWRLALGDFGCKLVVDLAMLAPFRLMVRSWAQKRRNHSLQTRGREAHATSK